MDVGKTWRESDSMMMTKAKI